MKNLISYRKSGLNALRKAFSLIVVLCMFLGASAQDMHVYGWWNVKDPIHDKDEKEVSRVISEDDCGMVYHVIIVSGDNGKREFIIRSNDGNVPIKAVKSSISTSVMTCEDNFADGACKFSILSGQDLSSFYLDFSTSPVSVTETKPLDADMIKISTTSKTTVNIGSKIEFDSKFCSSNVNVDLTYNWMISKDGETWMKAENNDAKKFEFTVVSDIKYIKCEATYVDPSNLVQSVNSNVIELTVNAPTFDIEIEGEGVRNVNSVEKEVPSWRDVVIKMVNLPSQNVSDPKISFKSIDGKGSYKPLTDAKLSDDKTSWTIYSDKGCWMKVEVDVEVPASDGSTTTTTLSKEFIFRLVYSPDKDDAVQMLFEDDFGYFVGNEYHFVKYDGGDVADADAVEIVDPSLPSNVKWMGDENGFIKEHKFALLDPRIARLPIGTDGYPVRDAANCWSKGPDVQPYQCWCETGFRVEDGYYAFVSNPSMADGGAKTDGGPNDYWNGSDHTGSNDGTKHGAMLMVNCAEDAKDAIIYERDFAIDGECSNVMVLFSAFVSNAQTILSGSSTPVNIRMDIFEKGKSEVLTSIESGNVITRNYGPDSWSNLTALFPLSKGDESTGPKYYTLKITNNAPSGSGNDILLDDISLKVCFPEIEVKADVTGDEILNEHAVVICGRQRDLTLTAFNRAGIENYIPTPSYLFQYFDETANEGKGGWKNLPKETETDDAISANPTMMIKLSNSDFKGDSKFRVIVGNSPLTIKSILGELVPPSCEYTYAISDTFHVMFNPVGDDLELFGCIGETIKVEANANGRPTIEWYDYSMNKLVESDSIKNISVDKLDFIIPESILKSNNMSDTLYMIATTVGGLCSDKQVVSITKYDDLDFNIQNDQYYCEFTGSLNAVDVYPTEGINYTWSLKGSDLADQTGSEFKVLKSTPEIFDNTVTVTGTADKFCPTTKTADYSIYRKYKLDLTVDVEGNPEKVANVCLPTDGESSSRVDLAVKKVYLDGSNPTYADEKVTTYTWYRKIGKDSVELYSGVETSYTDRLTENNIYKYSVTATDDVCYKNDVVAGSDSTTINARKPLVVTLTQAEDEICKGEDNVLTVKLENNLNPDTITSRLFENGSPLVELKGENVSHIYTPTNTTKEKETKNIKVEVMDMICSPKTPVTAEVNFDVFVPLVVTLSTDAAAGGIQKCITPEEGGDVINATVTVEQGNPRSIEWFDGKFPGLEFHRPVTVSQGSNKISIKAFDEVCRASDATAYVQGADTSIEVIASKPIVVKLTADKDSICNGDAVVLDMQIENSLVNNPETRWYEKTGDVEDLKYTYQLVSASKSHVPVNTTKGMIEKTMIVKTADDICNAGKDVMESVSYKIFMPIKILLGHDAVIHNGRVQKCITESDVDNVVELTVKVDQGNPSKLIWSDGNYNKDLVFTRQFVVSPGSNPIKVTATDSVCPASATDNDDLDIIAARPITLDLTAKNPDVCDGSDVEFDLVVNNTLDQTGVEVRWYDEGTKVYTTNGGTLTQAHTSSNGTAAKLSKTMVVKADDEICSIGTEITASAGYTVYKPVKFNLTSDALEFGVKNHKCLGQTSQGNQTSADITVNLTQGNPTKFVWSDEIVWDWSWADAEGTGNRKTRPFELKLGTNKLSVVAYDNVCNKEGASGNFEGEGQTIDIEARTPINVTLALASGRDVMCLGEDISLVATVHNDMEDEKTMLEWNETHGVADGLVDNGSYTTNIFTPQEGMLTYTVKATENAETQICPAQVASLPVDVRVNTTMKLFVSEDAICQDTSGRDTVKLVTLTAHVLTGKPDGIIWSTGDTTKIEKGYSYLKVAPMAGTIYSAYGYDKICVKTTRAYADSISVDHRVYVTLSAENNKVQMGDEVKLKTEYSIPVEDALHYYEMTSPKKKELEQNTDSEFSYELDNAGAYKFVVKVENGNCGVRKSNTVNVDVADYVVVPNVITPYNDNPKNDKFMDGYDVKIFNRYQETVYEGTDGWDATYRGQLATPGTYFYILTKKDGRVLKGTVEVYRK